MRLGGVRDSASRAHQRSRLIGRKRRQSRRAKDHRQERNKRLHATNTGPNWSLIFGIAVAVAAIAALVAVALFGFGKSAVAPSPTKVPTAQSVAGVGCTVNEQTTYHVHAHLALFAAGKRVRIPAYIGFNYDHDCLYWVHTHDTSGIIHIESPSVIHPTLGAFFAVWSKPLTASTIGTVTAKRGQQVRVWVNKKPYGGDPAEIVLNRHTDVQIDIGPPFPAPKTFDYNGL